MSARRPRSIAIAALLALSACGADDDVAPYTPPPPNCPEADEYLADLYRLEDEGKLTNLAVAIRHHVPDNARRDLIDALLRLAGAFEDGDFSALTTIKANDDAGQGEGLQVTLGRVVRWVGQTGPSAPNLPLMRVLRTTLSTCEGAPVFALLADAVRDPTLVGALLDTLASEGLRDGLVGLSFEGENGREAMRYLVRNVLVAASSDAFDVATIVDLLDLLVDLDAPPYRDLADGLERLLDADGLPRLQGLLVCLQGVDRELVLGAFVYDLLTSGLLTNSIPEDPITLDEPIREIVVKALDALATDPQIRRGLTPALIVLLADDVVPYVLPDLAELLESEALSGVFDLIADLAAGTCRVTPPQ